LTPESKPVAVEGNTREIARAVMESIDPRTASRIEVIDKIDQALRSYGSACRREAIEKCAKMLDRASNDEWERYDRAKDESKTKAEKYARSGAALKHKAAHCRALLEKP
jgi:hypothetical protein